MKVKYTGTNPIRFGARLVEPGQELDLDGAEANEAISGGRFAAVEQAKPEPKPKSKKKKPIETAEEES